MLSKIMIQIMIATLLLSISTFAQKTISLSEFNKIKESGSKNTESETSKITPPEKVTFSEFEQEVFNEVNNIRQNPLEYVNYLEEYKKMLNGKILSRPNQPRYMMIEGKDVIDETIAALQKTSVLLPLKASKLLAMVANNHLNDLKENPKLGHIGKDGSDFRKRMTKVGKMGKAASENINYRDRIARQTLLSMIIDDGVKTRMHRKNILNSEYNMLGVSCGEASDKQMICVLVFADKFDDIEPSKQAVPVEFR